MSVDTGAILKSASRPNPPCKCQKATERCEIYQSHSLRSNKKFSSQCFRVSTKTSWIHQDKWEKEREKN